MESRKSTRFHLEVPIICRWHGNDDSQEIDGLTRDISIEGIFVLAPDCPPVGANISFEAVFPPLQTSAPPLRLHGHGRVLRVNQVDDVFSCGFAATAGFTLRDSEEERFLNER